MAAVDIGTAPHTALHLSRDGRVLLATPVPNDAQSVGEDIVRRISILETDNGIPIGDLSEVMYLSWERFGHIAVASELLGLMQGALDMTVQYASERKQFGHVIGQFQSVQHMLADCHAQVESVRSIVRSAADEQDRHGPNARLARTAKIASSEAAMSVIETCIQVHGGIGHTWEYPLHLYLRRALLDRLLLGDESTLLEDVAREILSESAS
jgi:alkylation response protein AidB-like acyl-CoA dehydrogenase